MLPFDARGSTDGGTGFDPATRPESAEVEMLLRAKNFELKKIQYEIGPPSCSQQRERVGGSFAHSTTPYQSKQREIRLTTAAVVRTSLQLLQLY